MSYIATPTLLFNRTNTTVSPNSTNATIPATICPHRQYDNVSIPRWRFNSSCDWMVATYVDLAFSITGVFYNALGLFLPFFFSHLYNNEGIFMGSYAIGCLVCCLYYIHFDIRVIISPDDITSAEDSMVYTLVVFLAGHFLFHMYLVQWNQYRMTFRINSHLRFTTKLRLLKILFIVWGCAAVITLTEACFTNHVSGFKSHKSGLLFSPQVSRFRLVCLFILFGFFWFVPFIIMICWNGDLFCFLLKVIHNGYVVEEPDPRDDYSPEVMPELAPCPWVDYNDDEDFEDDDEPELPTLPDDVPYEFRRQFANALVTSLFGATMFVWLTYHVLALFRTGHYMCGYGLYDIIFNCYLYLCLYAVVKVVPLLNPLYYVYYRKEIHELFSNGRPSFRLHSNEETLD